MFHQQADAGRQTRRGYARVAHPAARPQLRPVGGQPEQPQVQVGRHRVAHRPAGPVQGAVHQQPDVAAVYRARAQSATRQGVSLCLCYYSRLLCGRCNHLFNLLKKKSILRYEGRHEIFRPKTIGIL